LPPQAASTQAAAIDVRRGVVRFIGLTDIVRCPCRLHVLLLFCAFHQFRRQGIIESVYLSSVKGNFHYNYFQEIISGNANRHFIKLKSDYVEAQLLLALTENISTPAADYRPMVSGG
jgi:hypothetical protein